MHIAAGHGIAMHITNIEAELVTPTGAAIVAAVRTADSLPEKYTIRAVGMGAGKRDHKKGGILRTMIIEDMQEIQAESSMSSEDCIYKLESNIDDCTGEALGYVMERLFAKGARDVNYMPVFMKKTALHTRSILYAAKKIFRSWKRFYSQKQRQSEYAV